MKVGTRHCSPAYASKVAGTAFGTARLAEFALSADDALLFRSVRPFDHRGNTESMALDRLHFNRSHRSPRVHLSTPWFDVFRPCSMLSALAGHTPWRRLAAANLA